MTRHPAFPYIAPFVAFLAFVALHSIAPLPSLVDEAARVALVGLVILLFSRPVVSFRASRVAGSVAIGLVIFGLWVLPDILAPGYRQSFLFNNFLTGKVAGSLSDGGQPQVFTLVLRTVRASLVVPIAEELFWRGWLMRWLLNPNFLEVPLGSWSPFSFFAAAILFATEHGPYWDVGLIVGVIFNVWMIRTKCLGDLMLAHATANASLSAYVMIAGKWEYWL